MEKPVGDLRLVLGRKYHFTEAVSRQGPLILAAHTEQWERLEISHSTGGSLRNHACYHAWALLCWDGQSVDEPGRRAEGRRALYLAVIRALTFWARSVLQGQGLVRPFA